MAARVTLQDVAAHAGVSRSAASLALREDGRLAPETRQRVLHAMDELGYVYNRSAAALRERHRRLVGIVVTNIDNTFFAQSLMAMEVELGYSAITASSLRSRERQDHQLRQMQEFGVDGVILAAVEGTVSEASRALEAAGLPYMSYTRFSDDESVDYVGPDDLQGGRLAASHLLGHGARSFAFIGSRAPSSASRMRRAELEDAGLAGTLRVVDGRIMAELGSVAPRRTTPLPALPAA